MLIVSLCLESLGLGTSRSDLDADLRGSKRGIETILFRLMAVSYILTEKTQTLSGWTGGSLEQRFPIVDFFRGLKWGIKRGAAEQGRFRNLKSVE